MARIRTIKPEFWTDEKTGQLSPMAKCLFIGLLNLADDYGIVEYRPAEWCAKLFPYYSDTTPGVLQTFLVEEILPMGLTVVFSVTNDDNDATRFLFISHFDKHQVVSKPSKPILDGWKKGDTPKAYASRTGKEFSELGRSTPGALPEYSGDTTGALPEHSGLARAPGNGKERKGNNNRSGRTEESQPYAFEHGVVRLTASDLEKWKKAFPHVAVEAELMAKEPWLAQQPKWFHAAAGWLAKAERQATSRGPPDDHEPPIRDPSEGF